MAKYNSPYTGKQIDESVELLKNNTASVGQILTADGEGGASWVTPEMEEEESSSSVKLYKHSIKFSIGMLAHSSVYEIISDNPDPFTFETIPQRLFGESKVSSYNNVLFFVGTSEAHVIYSSSDSSIGGSVIKSITFTDTVTEI